MASKAMKPGAPKPPTPEEREAQILRAIAMKREQYAVSAFNSIAQAEGTEIDPETAVDWAIRAADALIGKLYAQPLQTPETEK